MTDNDLINRNTLLELINTPIISLNEVREIIGIPPQFTTVVYDHADVEVNKCVPYNCVNCGGRISKQTGICLYCGTEY